MSDDISAKDRALVWGIVFACFGIGCVLAIPLFFLAPMVAATVVLIMDLGMQEQMIQDRVMFFVFCIPVAGAFLGCMVAAVIAWNKKH